MLIAAQLEPGDGAAGRQVLHERVEVKEAVRVAVDEDDGGGDGLGGVARAAVEAGEAAVLHDAGPVHDGLDGGGAVEVGVAGGFLEAGEVRVGVSQEGADGGVDGEGEEGSREVALDCGDDWEEGVDY